MIITLTFRIQGFLLFYLEYKHKLQYRDQLSLLDGNTKQIIGRCPSIINLHHQNIVDLS